MLPPTPWTLLIVGKSGQVIDAMRDTVITFDGVLDEDFWRGIVSAVNSHADLVRALEEIQRVSHNDFLTQSERISAAREFARAALATLTARKVG